MPSRQPGDLFALNERLHREIAKNARNLAVPTASKVIHFVSRRAGVSRGRRVATTVLAGAFPVHRHHIKRLALFLGLGAFVTVMVCVALAATDDLSTGISSLSEGYANDDRWTVTRWDRPAGVRIVSAFSAGRNWSPGQALGPPDSPGGGDQVTAWASAYSDGSREWLLLDFATPVVPKSMRVYEVCSTGALDRVEVTKPNGEEVVAWSGVDPSPRGGQIGTSEVPLAGVDCPVSRVRLHFDSPNVSGWNEVDAVALVATDGSVQYAVGVQASSVYVSGGMGSIAVSSIAAPAMLVPSWAGVPVPTADSRTATTVKADNMWRRSFVQVPTVIAEARGWPMLALAGRQELDGGNAASGAASAMSSGISAKGAMTSGPYPLSGFSGSYTTVSGGPSAPSTLNQRPLLTYRPIPLGFAVNTILAAIVLWLAHAALTVPRRFFKEVSRLRRGCCVACGYDVGYDFIAGCPECGWNRGGPRSQVRSTDPQTIRKSANAKEDAVAAAGH